MQDYDAIPYESTPISDAHPYKLAVLGTLLGLTPPIPATARVLEIGCAEGGTLIPLARLFPNAQLLGLELSKVQTDTGNQLIEQLGLDNVRIQQGDIMRVGRELGQFDYILSHGVFSWIPDDVQNKMLALCRDLLSPHGLVYISYNVNPGWRLRGALRDMFAYHLRDITSPKEKLAAAFELCDILHQGLGDSDTLMANYLRKELEQVRKARPAYVYHEYLESVNAPILFSDFVASASDHQLHYVCDTELYTMFPSSYGSAAEAMLEQFPDTQSTEQYADFLRMRTFRQSVLCHANCKPDYAIDLASLDRFAAYSNLSPANKPHLHQTRPDTFNTLLGKPIPIQQPLTKASLLLLESVYPDAIAVPELLQAAQRMLQEQGASKHAELIGAWRAELFNLLANNLIGFATETRRFPTVLDSLRATPLARIQAERDDGFVSTLWSETLSLDAFSKRLIQLLDGSRTQQQLIEQLFAELRSGTLALESQSKKSVIKIEQVAQNCARLLALFAQHGVLERAPLKR